MIEVVFGGAGVGCATAAGGVWRADQRQTGLQVDDSLAEVGEAVVVAATRVVERFVRYC